MNPILHQPRAEAEANYYMKQLGILLKKFSGKLSSAHAARLYYSLTHSL